MVAVKRRRGPKVSRQMMLVTEELMAECRRAREIEVRLCREFGCSSSTAYNYMRRVRESWAECDASNREERLARCTATVTLLFRLALEQGDFTNANRALRTLAELNGLIGAGVRAPVQNNAQLNVMAMTRQQREARIAELEAKRAIAKRRVATAT